MTTVSSATSSTAAATTAASATSSSSATTVDYNSFLQLLVQELKNQDPTSPSDPTQYLSQIATFSNVEQGVNMNSKLKTLLTSSALTQAESTIGRTVTSGTVSGTVSSVSVSSDGTATATLSSGGTVTLDDAVTIGGSSTSSTT
ncbi:flagellar hook assembly protein FlgD [Lichenihabitans sp. Uapishka_5]|uniref:flagellar hook assembly protein FlgD n=1 Tax=Lichenihabitans sp. Uapishka_5 TaxID=3037302 RepID=UPI0029E7E3B0|nr:flagellar hook assembly protein FlgD [Lichenihabitans sp. Uapishka_5]MDX7953069.1 flagellar hook assembly protein FlgD [Lichenihabitans sp. Uapishka_5]